MNYQFVNIDVQPRDRARAKNFRDLLAGRPLDLQSEYGHALHGIGQIGGLGKGISLIQVACAETATMRAWELGGDVLKDVIEIRGSGWLSLIRDPAGRKVGLFQPAHKRNQGRNGELTPKLKRKFKPLMERIVMKNINAVSRDEWVEARRDHLAKEKEFTRLRDQLGQQRRQLPWVKVDEQYIFDGPNGKESLADLFEGRSQLIVYHFMYGPEWEEGCPSCSFWADNFDGISIHLNHRDITLVTVSRAELKTLEAYRKRMGWSFKWVSSLENNFNRDYHVSFSPEEMEKGEMEYNFRTTSFPADEAPGISVFHKTEDGAVYHTYSCYARGLDMLNGAYHFMDLAPKGRDEEELSFTMAWLRRHDQYDG